MRFQDLLSRFPPPGRVVLSALRRLLVPAPPLPDLSCDEDDLLGFLASTSLGGAFHRALDAGALAQGAGSRGLREKAEAMYFGIYAGNMTRFAELGRIQDALGEEAELVPLKGVVAAALVHDDIGVRAMADVDVLAREKDIPRVCRTLEKLGYVETDMPLDPFVDRFGRHVPPRFHPGRKVCVEVHRSVDYTFSFHRPPDVHARARTARIDGRAVRVPRWEDFLYQWAVHAAYTDVYLGKLRDLFDLARLVESRGLDVDWRALEAFGFYALRPLWVGLRAAGVLFESAACDAAAERIAPHARMTGAVRRRALWLLGENLVAGRLARRAPLSVLSAVSFALHLPEYLPRFAAEFARVFLFPPRRVLRDQYGRAARILPRPFLLAVRVLHVAGLIGHRLWGKWKM
jgi:hypothetical protein